MRGLASVDTSGGSSVSDALAMAVLYGTSAKEAENRPESAAISDESDASSVVGTVSPLQPWVCWVPSGNSSVPVPKDNTASAYVDYVIGLSARWGEQPAEIEVADWYDEYRAVCMQAGISPLTPMKWSKGMERAGCVKRQVERVTETGIRRRPLVFDWPMHLEGILR